MTLELEIRAVALVLVALNLAANARAAWIARANQRWAQRNGVDGLLGAMLAFSIESNIIRMLVSFFLAVLATRTLTLTGAVALTGVNICSMVNALLEDRRRRRVVLALTHAVETRRPRR